MFFHLGNCTNIVKRSICNAVGSEQTNALKQPLHDVFSTACNSYSDIVRYDRIYLFKNQFCNVYNTRMIVPVYFKYFLFLMFLNRSISQDNLFMHRVHA